MRKPGVFPVGDLNKFMKSIWQQHHEKLVCANANVVKNISMPLCPTRCCEEFSHNCGQRKSPPSAESRIILPEHVDFLYCHSNSVYVCLYSTYSQYVVSATMMLKKI